MKFEIINPLDYPGWDDLLLTNEKSTFFHSSSWARVLSESYGYEPLYFTWIDSGKLSAMIPIMEVKSFLTGKRGVSLPFTDFCDPIISQEHKNQEGWEALLEHGRKAGWKYLEIRGGGDVLFKDRPPSSWYYEHLLDLSEGEQMVYTRFRDSNKRNIKKAKKAGIEVATSDSLESMSEFYRLNCMTRKMHGVPPQPRSFFREIFDLIISKGRGFLVIARYQGQAIAANVYFHFDNKAIYKYGASDIKYVHLRPNNLVMWKAIEWYCRKGLKTFSFGRTDPWHDGLRQFKAGWGTQEAIINYYRYDFHKDDFIKSSSGVNSCFVHLFKKTPVSALKLIGTLLYKHMA